MSEKWTEKKKGRKLIKIEESKKYKMTSVYMCVRMCVRVCAYVCVCVYHECVHVAVCVRYGIIELIALTTFVFLNRKNETFPQQMFLDRCFTFDRCSCI